jgi:hypothetical protein
MQGRWNDASAVLERINPEEEQQELNLLKRNVTESAGLRGVSRCARACAVR